MRRKLFGTKAPFVVRSFDQRLFFLSLLVLFVFGLTLAEVVWGDSEKQVVWEIEAPGGSEMNLTEERMVYHAADNGLVVVTSPRYQLRFVAGEVVYEKKKGIFFARRQVSCESGPEGLPEWRGIADEMVYSLVVGELLFPVGGQFFLQGRDGEELSFTAGWLMAKIDPASQRADSADSGVEQGLRIERFQAKEGFESQGQGWRLTGQTIEGEPSKGLFQAEHGVSFVYDDLSGRAERVIYDENTKLVSMTGEPVVFRGRDRIEGSELLLHLETGKITIRGAVKARLYH